MGESRLGFQNLEDGRNGETKLGDVKKVQKRKIGDEHSLSHTTLRINYTILDVEIFPMHLFYIYIFGYLSFLNMVFS
jgi:hypothetical protein